MNKTEAGIVKVLRHLDDQYYNHNTSVIPDYNYTLFKEVFAKHFPESDYLKEIGAEPNLVGKKKVKLARLMPSLSKFRPSHVLNWLAEGAASVYLITPKMDGISITLTYEGGKLVLATTRGNGRVGQDVTQHIKCVGGIPHKINLKGKVLVSGELIIRKTIFQKYYHKSAGGKYSAIRNFVGGQLNTTTLDVKTRKALGRCSLIVFGVQTPKPLLSKCSELALAKVHGFTTVDSLLPPFSSFTFTQREFARGNIAKDTFVDLIKKWGKDIDYQQDGLVIEADRRADKKKLGPLDSLLPTWSYAIKLDVADQIQLKGKIDHIEQNMSIRRRYAPVAVLRKKLDFDGALVDRCSFHNFGQVRDWKAGAGSTIFMARSGDVIPYAVKTSGGKCKLPDVCDWCESPLGWTKSKVDLYCTNPKCNGLPYLRFHHFVSCMKIDDIGPGVIDMVWHGGVDTLPKLFKVKASKLKTIDGMGDSTATTLVKGLKDRLSSIRLPDLMYASGLFCNPEMGLADSRLSLITETLGTKRVLEGKVNLMRDKLMAVHGLGDATVDLFLTTLPAFRKWLVPLQSFINIAKPVKATGPLVGKEFAFSNFRDADLIALIEKNGGKVGGVKKTTVALFAEGHSTKVEAAKKYGIPIKSASQATAFVKKMLK